MKSCRKGFTEALVEIARGDSRVFALATDSRGSVTLDAFARELPGQFVECGIAEQDAVGIAAGLTLEGAIAFVCGPAAFFSARAAEQVKVDCAYSHRNVKVIGVSGGVSYGALGGTHHAVQDIALMRAIAGLQVLLPADANQAAQMARSLARSPEPAYVRMGRGDVPDVYAKDAPFEIGRANLLRAGDDAALIACGEMVSPALRAADLLSAAGIRARVIDMHTIKPLDEAAVCAAAETGLVVTVEEHSIRGGLGGAVAELLAQRAPVRMRILGLPDEPLDSGTSAQVLSRYGLDAEGIARAVREALKR